MLVGVSLLAFLPASASAAGGCTLSGTNGPDRLRGGDEADVICGRGGNDTIYGLGRGDRLVGGPGDDHLYGGAGPDLLLGGPGMDVLRGGAGRDTLSGGPGVNSCPAVGATDTPNRCRPPYTRRHGKSQPSRPCWFDHPQTCGFTEAPDEAPPRLSWLGVNPPSADNTAGPTTVNVYVGALDASPVVSVKAHMRGPQGFSNDLSLTPGAQGGFESSGTLVLPAGTPTGIYAIDHLTIVDSKGNATQVSEAEIEAGQFPRELDVYAGPDEAGPTLESFSISPISVDTSTGAATVTLRARVTDALSGADQAGPSFDIPSQEPSKVFFPRGHGYGMERINGTVHDGEWTAEISLPHHAAQGNYELNAIQLHDRAGNFTTYDREEIEDMGFPVTFTETGPGDVTGPEVTDFWMKPTTLRASHGERTIFFYVHVKDDLSGFGLWPDTGFSNVRVDFEPPGEWHEFESTGTVPQLISGTVLDGIWRSETVVEAAAPVGEYVINYVAATDLAGWTSSLDTTELETAGLPTSFVNLP